MNYLNIIFGILFLGLFGEQADAYVVSRGLNGSLVHWANGTHVQLNIKTTNSHNVSSSKIWNIVVAAADEWNSHSTVKIIPVLNSGSIISGVSNLYFSSGSSSVFSGMGTGVLGITQTLYDASGKILGGDIIINDSFTMEVDDATSNSYLGNIVTHEIGHLLGLSHTEVKNATMAYTALRGQTSIASDDEAGIYSLYPTGSKGTISGQVIGSENLIGVLGAHVQAVSRQTGKVKAGVYSDADGSFSITGLDLDESYYLYVSPASMLAQVPDYYSESKKNFCSSGAFYRGSFFESCRASDVGFPQEINLTSSHSSFNVGLVTIRCDLGTSQDYLSRKPFVVNDYLLFYQEGKSFSGFFTSAEIAQGATATVADVFQIDLRSHLVVGTEYLDLKTISQAFYSRLIFKIQVKVLDGSNTIYNFSPTLDSENNMNADYNIRIPLNLNQSSNIFEVTVTPVNPSFDFFNREQWNWGAGIYGLSELFPNYSVMNENLKFYLFMYGIAHQNGDGNFTLLSSTNEFISDNTTCPDGPRTYKIAATKDEDAFSAGRRSKKLDQATPIACGSTDSTGGNGKSGPFMLSLGIILTFILRLLLVLKRPWIMARPIS